MQQSNKSSSTRVKAIQKLYSTLMNPDEVINYPKGQYRKFIKDIVTGTIERKELIEENINNYLADDLNLNKTDNLIKIIIFDAIFELLFKHKNPTKVIISEYVKASEFFLENAQIKFLNAILDKISKKIRNENN